MEKEEREKKSRNVSISGSLQDIAFLRRVADGEGENLSNIIRASILGEDMGQPLKREGNEK